MSFGFRGTWGNPNNNNNNNNSSTNFIPQQPAHQQYRRQRDEVEQQQNHQQPQIQQQQQKTQQQLNTELVEACKSGDETELASLINRGADPNTELHTNPAITFAISNNHPGCARLLLLSGCTKAAAGRMPLLHYALFTSWPSLDTIKTLVDGGCNVNDRYLGMAPISIAVRFGRTDVVEYLAKTARADLSMVTKENETLAYIAASHGHTETLQLLLGFNVVLESLNTKTSDSLTTALFASIEHRHFECAKLLIGSKRCRLDEMVRNETPFFKAADVGSAEILKVLKNFGSAGNVPGKFGVTAIRAATMGNHLEAVKYLLSLVSTKKAEKMNAARDAKMMRHDACFLAIVEDLGLTVEQRQSVGREVKVEVKGERFDFIEEDFEGGERRQ